MAVLGDWTQGGHFNRYGKSLKSGEQSEAIKKEVLRLVYAGALDSSVVGVSFYKKSIGDQVDLYLSCDLDSYGKCEQKTSNGKV